MAPDMEPIFRLLCKAANRHGGAWLMRILAEMPNGLSSLADRPNPRRLAASGDTTPSWVQGWCRSMHGEHVDKSEQKDSIAPLRTKAGMMAVLAGALKFLHMPNHSQGMDKESSKKNAACHARKSDVPKTPRKLIEDTLLQKKKNKNKNVEKTTAETVSNSLEAFTLKEELKNTGEVIVTKRKAKTHKGNHDRPEVIQPHIDLATIVNIEMELVYINEEDITYEFLESQMPQNLLSTCPTSEEICSQSTSNFILLPETDKFLQKILEGGSNCYRQNNFAAAAGRLTTALEMCSKGNALGKLSDASAENISSVVSFIETKLVACYLRMKQPELALSHAHRSIALNPSYFRNHIRQATVFISLERYSEAARCAMIADYIYWLSGGRDANISKLIKLYWQVMHEEAMARAKTFSVMYTPLAEELQPETIEKVKDSFIKSHPTHAKYVYTDDQLHILPQTTDWSSDPPHHYLLTLGFKTRKDGVFLEKQRSQSHVFVEDRNPFHPLSQEEAERHLDILRNRIMPVVDFMRCTKFLSGVSPCSGVIGKLQYASILSQLQQAEEESQVINQAQAELATIPYLQEISQQDVELLKSLIADVMDCLQGRCVKEYTWNKIQKVEMIEDFLHQLEERFLKAKKLRTARRQRMKMKKLQRADLSQSVGTATASTRPSEEDSKDINTMEM
ncbi:spermatogenesis-associated protein 16 [Spea bombifrons]|uniref:spermatogenesis-associated protein 16 n=1 Tax=Spea bombifrons TaxID=233779 RepID=UPI00234A2942|nr:spermatogenesis-associated protein 16 [Spea bombifrons]